jgi:hypothetical protein
MDPADGPPACHRAGGPSDAMVEQLDIERLMAPEGTPDVGELQCSSSAGPSWHRWGGVQGADPDQFFPGRGDGRPFAALA